MKIACCLLLLIPCCATCQTLFTLVPPERSGIRFQNTITESATQNVLAYEYFYNGGGVAVGDLNNDGLPDIVFTSNMGQPQVYFNKGNFVFEDVSRQSRIKADGWKTGVTMADVNGDGWLDVYICRSGNGDDDSRRNLLFVNQKNGTFREAGARYGIDDKGNSTQAVFFDYDHDGDLDLFILNHSIKRLKNFDVAYMKAARDSVAGDKLYRNDGNGHFTDVSGQAGIIGNPICFGLGVAIADFNGDGWPDMYVTNDYDEDDYLYINQKNGTFRESLSAYLGHTSKYSMGCDVADVNNDGMSDLLTLDMLPEDNRRQKLLKGPDGYDHFQMLLNNGYYYQYMRNMLHVATKAGDKIGFSEVGQLAGISNTDWSWSALFGDFDLDGWQDLFITNGYMRDYTNMDFLKYTAPDEIAKSLRQGQKPNLFEMVKKMPASELKSYLFRNTGKLGFENVTQEWGMGLPALSNGAAYGDFDNDGDWDLVVNNINQPAFVWQNHAEDRKNNYLKIRFHGDRKNGFGVGARVIVSASDGFKQIQELEMTHGFQSSMEPCLIFGLGKRQTVDIDVTWPGGKRQVLTGQAVNRTLILNEKDAGPADGAPNGGALQTAGYHPLFTEVAADAIPFRSDGIPFRHVEDDYNDFKREPLLPHQYSRMGPALAIADVDGDGKKDVFISGGKGQPPSLYINDGKGHFARRKVPAFEEYREFEGVQALFADFDHNGTPDLYLVSGGNATNFQDQLYLNDGKGNFTHNPDVLPPTESSGGAVAVLDLDGDGDLDIFRGGQVTTGAYPTPPRSYLFRNDHGTFKDVTPEFMRHIGMVNTAAVADIDKDGVNDLVLAGEFMPVTILFGQRKAPYFSADRELIIPHSSGWWNCLKVVDLDGDGYPDLVAGNEGLNCQMKPSPAGPVTLDAVDIDGNGSMDPIFSYFIQGKSCPVATRDELFDQVPSLKVKFPSYAAYADATVKDIIPPEAMSKAIHLEAEEFRSGWFRNVKGTFHWLPFAAGAQAFPVRDILIGDFNHDGLPDLLLVGNNYSARAEWGREDAGKGLLLLQGKEGEFLVAPDPGIRADKDARKVARLDDLILIANNNDAIQVYHID
ncbi:MAG: VCBS repeat-containing protein [Bacteroidota bacterium]|nr:VCBS repeat-containing protein [Bacteroidota bacterium]